MNYARCCTLRRVCFRCRCHKHVLRKIWVVNIRQSCRIESVQSTNILAGSQRQRNLWGCIDTHNTNTCLGCLRVANLNFAGENSRGRQTEMLDTIVGCTLLTPYIQSCVGVVCVCGLVFFLKLLTRWVWNLRAAVNKQARVGRYFYQVCRVLARMGRNAPNEFWT